MLMLPIVKKLSGKKATLILCTDEYIGEGLDDRGEKKENETRVGLIPKQIEMIKYWLGLNGIALDFYFF